MSRGDWKRVSRSDTCPICEKHDWCLVAADATAAICARTQSEKPVGNHGAGWLHRLVNDARRPMPRRRRIRSVPAKAAHDFGALAARYMTAVDHAALERLAQGLGASASSLRRLGVGWDGDAYTFPMCDCGGRITGIRRRFPNGRKLSAKGGREGLFVPRDLAGDGLLLVCEGPTDTVALLDLGFDSVGRPSCRGGVRLLQGFCKGRCAVVFADSDEPGRIGAWALARALRLSCASVKVIRPPNGVKDARDWVRRGATRRDVLRAIEAAEPVRLTVRSVCARKGVECVA